MLYDRQQRTLLFSTRPFFASLTRSGVHLYPISRRVEYKRIPESAGKRVADLDTNPFIVHRARARMCVYERTQPCAPTQKGGTNFCFMALYEGSPLAEGAKMNFSLNIRASKCFTLFVYLRRRMPLNAFVSGIGLSSLQNRSLWRNTRNIGHRYRFILDFLCQMRRDP